MDGLKGTLVGLLTLALIVSFGLHSIDVKHVHVGGQHSDHLVIEEYTHAIEQKFFVLLLFTFLLGSFLFTKTLYSSLFSRPLFADYRSSKRFDLPKKIYYLQELFSSGILNPKLH